MGDYRAELAAWLAKEMPPGTVIADSDWWASYIARRVADLLQQFSPSQSLRPIPVSERLPGPKDCDAQGRCWFGTYASDVLEANWVFRKLAHQRHWDTHWLPANALPLPEENHD